MIKSKISVFARLKPKPSKKNKIIFEINDASSDKGNSVAKLTISNKKENDSNLGTRNKLKNKPDKPIVSNSKEYSMKMNHKQRYSRKSDHRSSTLVLRDTMGRVGTLH